MEKNYNNKIWEKLYDTVQPARKAVKGYITDCEALGLDNEPVYDFVMGYFHLGPVPQILAEFKEMFRELEENQQKYTISELEILYNLLWYERKDFLISSMMNVLVVMELGEPV